MNEHSSLQIQALQLRELLENAKDDPILEPQLKKRLAEAEEKLKSAVRPTGTLFPAEPTNLPRAAVFLKGGGVQGSEGIRPGLAGEALIQYERMFTEQALHDERETARTLGRQRRPRGSSVPSLYFSGTPRGSFGLEFVPNTDDALAMEVHARSLKNVARALMQVGSDSSLEDVVSTIPPRVLQPMKQFLKVLSQYGAELRLAFNDAPPQSLSIENVRRAADRLEREVLEEELRVRGIFRGLTRESVVFDLLADDIGLITGTIADDLSEEDLERIDSLTNHRCIATVQRTTLRRVGSAPQSTYLLLEAKAEEPAEPSDASNAS